MSDTLVIEDLCFVLRRSPVRKTLGITVDRDGTLILTAPPHTPVDQLELVARAKLFWVYKKLAEKRLLFRPTPAKEYVNGEGFLYLGRSYRLSLVSQDPAQAPLPPLRLHQGRFQLYEEERCRAALLFQHWYTIHGRYYLQRHVSLFSDRIGVRPQSVEVRDLGFHWGSCGVNGILYFHWRTALLPPRIIEYIVAHELVHLHEPRHNAAFWARLERAMPDYASRKQWLAESSVKV